MADDRQRALLPVTADHTLLGQAAPGLPEVVQDAGAAARFAFEEFIHAQVRNPATRKAYLHAVEQFSKWCVRQPIALNAVTPADVARHLDSLAVSLPTRKLHLSALRKFFDGLVLRHVVILNPAISVRTERYLVIEGRTPEISKVDARRLLHGIDVTNINGARDFAVIGILIYTAARVGAVAKLRRRDFYESGGQYFFRFHEKGGKIREIPARHDLQQAIVNYLELGGLDYADGNSPLFRSTIRRTRQLTMSPLTADDMARMLKRRLRQAGLSCRLSPHSFRVTTLTDLLEQGVPLEDVQYLAGHSDPRTTRLYDRRRRRITRNIVERISI